jgi:hypothetical protein
MPLFSREPQKFEHAGKSILMRASLPSPTMTAGPELKPFVTQASSSVRLSQIR